MTSPEDHEFSSFVPDTANQRLLRDALGRFGTGVTIVTAAGEDGPAAITVNSFASVSLSPPLVLWSLDKHSSRYRCFSSANHYSIHVLCASQESLCMEVAHNPLRLHELDLSRNEYGVPVLSDCLVRFDCARETLYEAGDHMIVLGQVMRATMQDNHTPLAFFKGSTGTFMPLDCAGR